MQHPVVLARVAVLPYHLPRGFWRTRSHSYRKLSLRRSDILKAKAHARLYPDDGFNAMCSFVVGEQ